MKKIINTIGMIVIGSTMSIVAQPKAQLNKTDYIIKPEADKISNFKVSEKETNPFVAVGNYKNTIEIKAKNEFATPIFVEVYSIQTGVLAQGNYKGQNKYKPASKVNQAIKKEEQNFESVVSKK